MGNYLVYVRENRTFAGSSDLQLLRLHGNINNHFVYFFYTLPEKKTLKKKLNSMRVFIGQAALTFCSPSLYYSRGVGGGGGGGELLRILGEGVPPGSSNPDPISNQKCHFSHRFSDMASKIHTHSQTSL